MMSDSPTVAEQIAEAKQLLTTPGAITQEQYNCVRRLGVLMDAELLALWEKFNAPQINPVTYVQDSTTVRHDPFATGLRSALNDVRLCWQLRDVDLGEDDEEDDE
jgi:hypothetical protein